MFHLLIVEDEKRTREGLCRHIDWNGIGVDPVTAVAGGMEALLAVDDIKPDILLSDIRMPHMTGIELATIIRKKFPRCKIIFLSGYADKEYLMSAIELKVVNYIEKPIDVVEIRKAVSKAVMQLESEQKEELIHDGFQKALPIIHEEIVSALVSPGLDWQ
ncbi:response regulator, partial [Hungatella effluvii]